jgi:pimeloyl-ACP methyl ester carboxylesterase
LDATLIPTLTKTITVQEKTWRYRIAGKGEQTVVVLSGALGAGDLFTQHIAELLPDVYLVTPEYLPANSVSEFLDAFEAILKAENLRNPIVYGGSFGGLLAQCLARRNPQSITALILSGAVAPDAKRISKYRRILKILPFLPMPLVRMMTRMAAIKMTKTVPKNKELWRTELQNLGSKILREDLASRYNTAMDYDQNFHFMPNDLSEMPIMLLEGSEDRVANKKARDQMRALYPHAEVTIVEGAGHSVLLTHPQQWKNAVAKFILNHSDSKERT